jgi:hypothetical protein
MKTAMQELIEFIDFSIKHCHDNERIRIHQLVVIKERAKQYLEKEKEQIIKSWNNGYSIGCVVGSNDYTIEDEEKDNGNYYYNETYNQNEG